MKIRHYFQLLLVIFLLLPSPYLEARPGGGGGTGGGGGGGTSGGGGGGSTGGIGKRGIGGYRGINNNGQNTVWDYVVFIGFIVFGSFTGFITTVLLWKSKLSNKILSRILPTDSFWNINDMKYNARRVFYNMSEAWENHDMERVKNYVTIELYKDYSAKLAKMKERKEKNIISSVDITETRIIGCEDYKDNSKDRYIAYIKGTILDYTILEDTGEIIKNPKKEIEDFSDTYHFIRVKNQWVLEKIDNSVSILDLAFSRNYKE